MVRNKKSGGSNVVMVFILGLVVGLGVAAIYASSSRPNDIVPTRGGFSDGSEFVRDGQTYSEPREYPRTPKTALYVRSTEEAVIDRIALIDGTTDNPGNCAALAEYLNEKAAGTVYAGRIFCSNWVQP